MSFRAMVLRQSLLFVLPALLMSAETASAQVANSPIVFANSDALTVSFVAAPALSSTSGGGIPGSSDQWLKVDFHYAVTPDKTPWVDSVEFKIWIEGRDMFAANAPGKDGASVALTGTVTYVNLAKTRDSYGVFYVHPSTLMRYSTSSGYEDFDRKFNIHIEAYVGGTLVDRIDKFKDKGGDDWFKPLTPIPGLIYKQNDSPFVVSDVTHYPAIKQSAQAQGGQ